MESTHEKHIIEKLNLTKKNGSEREFCFHYRKTGGESTAKNHFTLREPTIVKDEREHFFQEKVLMDGKEIGVARMKLSSGEKMNLTSNTLKEDLVKSYFQKGKPNHLFLKKGIQILSAK